MKIQRRELRRVNFHRTINHGRLNVRGPRNLARFPLHEITTSQRGSLARSDVIHRVAPRTFIRHQIFGRTLLNTLYSFSDPAPLHLPPPSLSPPPRSFHLSSGAPPFLFSLRTARDRENSSIWKMKLPGPVFSADGGVRSAKRWPVPHPARQHGNVN